MANGREVFKERRKHRPPFGLQRCGYVFFDCLQETSSADKFADEYIHLEDA
jgi:hypothetical protein